MKKTAVKATAAEQLRGAIRSSGSIASTARGAGIAQPVLHRFMTGERDLTLRTVEKLLKYLGLEVRPRQYGEWGEKLIPLLKELIREARKDRVLIDQGTLCALASKIEKVLTKWDGQSNITIHEE